MKKVAFIGTGGTISSIGKDGLDIIDYAANKTMLDAEGILASIPEIASVADVVAIKYANVLSLNIYFDHWKAIADLCRKAVQADPTIDGIVIGHGTATLEETAYFLSLVLKVDVPVVIVGSQRPMSAVSSDAKLNFINAVRTAIAPDSRGRGVLVLLNDEIHAAREVTKTSTFRMQTFRTPDFGILGYVDGDRVQYYRRSERVTAPHTEFDISNLDSLPRVDISFAYTGADGAEIDAYVQAGAKGIVSAGFAPGAGTMPQIAALERAKKAGVVVVQGTRVGSGVVHRGQHLLDLGFLTSDNLNPQKARLLLALALTVTTDAAEVERIFATY